MTQQKPRTGTIIAARIALIALIALGFGCSDSTGQSKVKWYSFDEGAKLAAKESKILLVDVYTDWCGWCKKMDANVYSNDAVAKVMNQKFIAVKLNAESAARMNYKTTQLTEQEFARAVGVTGYPTTLFLKSDLTPLTLVPGYLDSEKFTGLLDEVVKAAH